MDVEESSTSPFVVLQARLKERAKETKGIVIEQLQAEEAAAQAAREGPKEMGDIDTDDEAHAEEEYVQWKNREYARIRCPVPLPSH